MNAHGQERQRVVVVQSLQCGCRLWFVVAGASLLVFCRWGNVERAAGSRWNNNKSHNNKSTKSYNNKSNKSYNNNKSNNNKSSDNRPTFHFESPI